MFNISVRARNSQLNINGFDHHNKFIINKMIDTT